VLQIPTSPRQFYLALIIELDTSNVLDVPLDVLTKAGLDLTARYVSRRPPTEERGFRPKPELLGAVATIEDDDVLLTDNIGEDRVPISHVWLEARQENLEAIVRVMYPRHAERILARLQQLRAIYTTAQGKLTLIRQTLRFEAQPYGDDWGWIDHAIYRRAYPRVTVVPAEDRDESAQPALWPTGTQSLPLS